MSNTENSTKVLTELPPVAKSFYAFCKKCEAERFHTVLAHKTATSAKIQCEVCKSIKSWSLPKSAEKKAATGLKTAATRRTNSEASRRTAYQAKYETLLKEYEKGAQATYNMKAKFEINQKVAHPKFGLGVVTAVFSDKVEVHFPTETRVLIHNRV